jgi:hypothetical protein
MIVRPALAARHAHDGVDREAVIRVDIEEEVLAAFG